MSPSRRKQTEPGSTARRRDSTVRTPAAPAPEAAAGVPAERPAPEAAAGVPAERPAPFRVRLPGFLIEREIGLGDVIKRATSSPGISPCGGCEKRARALNRRVVLSPGPRR